MKTWLISWTPDYSRLPEQLSRWPQSKQVIDNVQKGQTTVEDWRFSSTQVEVGDRVFLIKIGQIDKKQKGIFASGTAVSTSFIRDDGTRAAKIEFDRIIDSYTHDILSLDFLENEYPNQVWSSQSSGIEIREEYAERLVQEWNNFDPVIKPFYEILINSAELNPNLHDGSYELVKEVINAYSRLEDLSNLDYPDLNLIYLMTIISESKNRATKLSLVDASNLTAADKIIIKEKINKVFDKAENREYENRSYNRDTVGMFGTGFYSFKTKTDIPSAQKFIKLCIDINNLIDENQMLEIARVALTDGLKGLGSASASQVLHCLKPSVFPVINRGKGPEIYNKFGIKFDRYLDLKNYVSYVYQIKEMRDDYFTFKNYRILDAVGEQMITNSARVKPTNIDFLSILKYLENNHNKPYQKPEDITDLARRTEMETLKSKGQKVVTEFKKIASICNQDYELNFSKTSSWGKPPISTEIADYLWLQLGYSKEDNPHSISLFTEIIETKVRFRVSIEIKTKEAKESDYDKHHKFLDLALNDDAGLVYVTGFDINDITQELHDREIVKQKLNDETFKRVQLSKIIDYDETTTNDELDDAVFAGIEALLPYYEHVLGKENLAQAVEPIEETIEEGIESLYMKIEKNLILYGPPGTGKTYNSKNYAVAICEDKPVEEVMQEDYSEVLRRYDEYVDNGQIAFTTFHQSYGYEEFIEGIHPEVNENDQVIYKTKDGVFKEFCIKAESYIEPRVFIIDEINRGNISKIFGELITIIEDSKREGSAEAMNVLLPYLKHTFSVPNNVYILGTMNTADRSIALMDTALRRRFAFVEMMPKVELLNSVVIDGLNIEGMLKTINKRIEVLYDREHTIGHAYFMGEELNLGKLAHIFKNKIIPLLQEYFYEDYEKIQWVLGDNAKVDESIKFIKKIKNERSLFKGNTDIDMNILPEYRYEINEEAFNNLESYKQII